MRVDSIADLPPGIRNQAAAQLEKQHRERESRRRRAAVPADDFDSVLEREYYLAHIWPGLQRGEIAACELHRTFELLPAREYSGIKLPKVEYTPDFLLTYPGGRIEAVEVKSRAVRRLQKGYTYRRRLFIEIVAEPRGWAFREELF